MQDLCADFGCELTGEPRRVHLQVNFRICGSWLM